ncbi:MAG: tripartite tricarboxylate transporter substrate binding protein [Methylobacteriaceae bacterium]|jgi:tripartite-type tricarboxylate transporter receptor subunit TctC|nr:tripartite tricarboxylate transporter substrate binding protein [Methylobacteriaceae bacterium]
MKKPSISLLLWCMTVLAGTWGFTSSPAVADDYPDHSLRIVVGYGPGGGSDRTTRTLQKYLEKQFGKEVVVENMAGAGGLVAQTALARSKADGYMLTNINFPAFAYGVVMQKPPFTFKDLIPMWVEVCDPIILAVKKESPWNDFADFVKAVKDAPGKYSVSVASMGGQHANALWLRKNLGLDYKIVPYNSGGEAASALLGGHVDAVFGDAVSRADMRDLLKSLAVVDDKPNPIWPEGKPLYEQLEQFKVELPVKAFQARFGAYWIKAEFKEKYPDRYKKLVDVFKAATSDPEYKEMAEKSGITPSLLNVEGTGLDGGFNYQASFEKEYSVIESDIVPLFEQK